jgi:hypothetical protein
MISHDDSRCHFLRRYSHTKIETGRKKIKLTAIRTITMPVTPQIGATQMAAEADKIAPISDGHKKGSRKCERK